MVRAMALRLITTPISHFCEKARWALERAGLPYEEDAHLPLFQYPAVRKAGGTRQVPVLMTPSGGVADSTAILRWIDTQVEPTRRLFPADDPSILADVVALEERFDQVLGPAARRVAYLHLLPRAHVLKRYLAPTVPAFEKAIFPAFLPLLVRLIRTALKVTPEKAARDHEKLVKLFGELSERLSDGRRYLTGDRFTAADLTFASLAAPVLLPKEYGVPLPTLDEVSPEFRALVEQFRATRAGTLAMRLYREERRPAEASLRQAS